MKHALPLLLVLVPALSLGCGSSSGGSGGSAGSGAGGSSTGGSGTGASATGGSGTAGSTTGGSSAGGSSACEDVPAPDEVLPDATDPEAGDFTLDEALADLPAGAGPLRAILDTDLGVLTCTFHPDEAPIGVANFIGLARGRRAFKDPITKKWVRRKFYDGLTFHRVIPEFVAQGGDPIGNGTGGPGYQFVNETSGGLTHLAGTLAYANAGPDTNGSQFYICETPQPQLDSGYTIFGECSPVSVVTAMTHVETTPSDKPVTPIHLKTVTVTRCAE